MSAERYEVEEPAVEELQPEDHLTEARICLDAMNRFKDAAYNNRCLAEAVRHVIMALGETDDPR